MSEILRLRAGETDVMQGAYLRGVKRPANLVVRMEANAEGRTTAISIARYSDIGNSNLVATINRRNNIREQLISTRLVIANPAVGPEFAYYSGLGEERNPVWDCGMLNNQDAEEAFLRQQQKPFAPPVLSKEIDICLETLSAIRQGQLSEPWMKAPVGNITADKITFLTAYNGHYGMHTHGQLLDTKIFSAFKRSMLPFSVSAQLHDLGMAIHISSSVFDESAGMSELRELMVNLPSFREGLKDVWDRKYVLMLDNIGVISGKSFFHGASTMGIRTLHEAEEMKKDTDAVVLHQQDLGI